MSAPKEPTGVICKRCEGNGWVKTKTDMKLCEQCRGSGET